MSQTYKLRAQQSLPTHLLPIQPLLGLPIQQIMLPPIYTVPFPAMARQIEQYLHPHRLLLQVRQMTITRRIRAQPLVIQHRHPIRRHGDQFILLVPMPDKDGAPLAAQLRVIGVVGLHLLPEEDKAAVALGIGLTHAAGVAGQPGEALRDGRLHLGDGAGGRGVDVGGAAVDAVHDEGAVVHAGLRGLDEGPVVGQPRPGRVDVGVRVEDRAQVLPLAGVAVAGPALGELAEHVSLQREVAGPVVADGMFRARTGGEGVQVWHCV